MNGETVDTPTQSVPEPEYAIVEIMGHRRHVGMITEAERFGAKLLRIDEVRSDGSIKETHYYSGASIFSITPTDRETVMRIAKTYERPAVAYRRPYDDEFEPADIGDEPEDIEEPAKSPDEADVSVEQAPYDAGPAMQSTSETGEADAQT